MDGTVKILFLAASPIDTVGLELGFENRSIKESLQNSKYRDNIQVENAWAVQDDDMLRLMNQHHPNIVHFSGHGIETGAIIVEKATRLATTISPIAIKSLFQNFKKYTRLVILNACYSYIPAKMIAEDIDCVIGTNQAITDQTAIKFVTSFYSALGFGESVQSSFDQALSFLQIKNTAEEDAPQLFTRQGIDASKITLAELALPASQSLTPEKGSIPMNRHVSIFISYDPSDDSYRNKLEKHLSVMKRQGLIDIWHMKKSGLGAKEKTEQKRYIDTADIILLLISPDFLFSDSIYEGELKPAIERRDKGLARVIPIIVRKADWNNDPLLSGRIALPRYESALADNANRLDQKLEDIVREIRRMVEHIRTGQQL